MPKKTSVDKTSKEFIKYLESAGISANSLKFYKSDLNHFTGWFLLQIRSLGVLANELTQAIPFLKTSHSQEYKKYLFENKEPIKTINRRLSTLRNLSRFLTQSQIINFNFTEGLTNITTAGEERLQIHPLVKGFQKHLEAEKVSASTIKNYLADIRQFISPSLPKITPELLKAYFEEISKRPSQATAKRKIASLKKFVAWAQKQGLFKDTFLFSKRKLFGKNIFKKAFYASLQDKIIKRLEQKPKIQKIAHSLFYKRPNWYKAYHDISITNYIHIAILVIFSTALGFGAYNQFFKGTSTPLAYPTSLTPPNRYLSFQGRLTNNLGNPITVSTNLVFKLYDAASAGNTLWNAAATACAITPDSDGIFSTLLGSTCPPLPGGAIAATVFSENPNVWVGVKVGTDAEATPRIQIATVGYALNAETLQGYPPSATGTINTIPLINNDGDLIIAAASPTIQSTSGTFGIDGQAISIITTAASNGNITIAPNGTGQLLLIGGTTTTDFTRITDANLSSGSLISAYVGNGTDTGRLMELTSGSSETDRFAVSTRGRTLINANGGGQAALIINQLDSAPLFTASASGVTKITFANDGAASFAGAITGSNLSGTNTGDQLVFKTITPTSGTSPVADTTTDTLTLTAGTGITITGDATTDTVTIASTTVATSLAWSGLTYPTDNLSLAMAEFTSTFTWNTADTAAAFDGLTLALTNDATTDANTQRLLVLQNNDAAGSTATERLLVLNNTDTDEAVTTALEILSEAGTITTAIDVSDAEITNAINVGANTILGTNSAIDFSEFDVSGTTGAITINDDGNLGNISIEGTILDINSLDFVAAGSITTAASSALTLNMNAGDAAGEDLIITANNIALLATGALSITPDAALTTAIDLTDTDLTNALSIGDNNIIGTTYTITGTTAVIDFTDFDVSADGIVTFASDVAGDQITITSPAGDHQSLVVDAVSAANTSTAGIIDLNIGAGDAALVGLDINLTQNDLATAGRDAIAGQYTLTANDADGDVFGLVINALATVNAAAGSYEAAIKIDNAENIAGSMTDAILITATTDTAITDAIDVSDAEITNAINVGANTILGTNSAIDFSEFDVSGTTGAITINDGGDAGNISIEGTVLDIDSLDFVAAGAITTGGTSDLTINPAGGDVLLGASDNLSLTASTNLVFSDTATSLGEATSAVDSGAYKVGVFDEFDNSASVNVQAVLNDLDAAITSAASVYSKWTIGDDDADTYNIVADNILRFTSSDSNVLTNLTNGDDTDENLDLTVRLLKDAVAGSGLTGGADDVLVGADTDVTFTVGAGNGITVNADDVAVNQDYAFSWTNSHTWTLGAAELLTIDASTTDHTGTTGVIDINSDSSTTNVVGGAYLTFTSIDDDAADTLYGNRTDIIIQNDTTATDTVYGEYIDLTNSDTNAAGTGLYISVNDASAGVVNSGILIANLQSTDIDLTDAILIQATTADSIADAIDVSDAEITNAINVGANTILGTNSAIDLSEFDVSGTTGAITINDDGNLGNISIEGTVLDIDSLDFVAAGAITTAASSALTLNMNAGDAAGEDLIITANNIALLATGALSITPDAALTTAIDLTDTDLTNALSIGDNDITGTTFDLIGTTGTINYTNFDVDANGHITVKPAYGLDTNAAGELKLGDTTATTVSLGTTAATILNLGAGGALARAINIGTGTGVDTIHIGDGATGADVITLGSANAGAVTVQSAAALTLHGEANSIIDFPNFDVATTGNITTAGDLAVNGGNLTSTATTFNFDIGNTGTINFRDGTNVLAAISDQGTTGRLAISDSLQVGSLSTLAYSRLGTAATGHAGNLTTSDDLLLSGDLELNGVLYLDGAIIANSAGTSSIILSSTPTTTASSLSASNWLIENTANLGQAALMVNQTKAGDLFTASASGSPKFVITNSGNVGIGTTGPAGKLDITDTSNTAASLSLTNNTATTIGNGIDTLGVLDLQSTSLTTGNFFNMELNALTSGKGLNLTSTSTGLTGDLANITASGSNAAVTGSVLKVGLTGALATGTALNVTSAGASGFALRVNDDGTYTDTTPFVIDYAGNVGIGTTSPTNILSLGNAAAQKFWIENTAAGTVGRALTVAAGGTVAGTADITGGNLILQSGLGTGTGASTISFQTGTTLTTGTTLQTMETKMTILGSGNVGIGTTAPGGTLSVLSANATGLTTSSALNLSANSLTTGTGLYAASSTLTSGKLVDLQVSGTAAAASQTALNILTAGATATSAITTYGAQISNTHTNATSGTNVALYLNASGATTANYGLIVNAGNVGIGTTAPATQLDVNGNIVASADIAKKQTLATDSDLTAYTTTSDAYTTVKTFTISVTGGRVVKEINYKADIKNSTAATTTSLKLMSGDDMKEATKIGSEVTKTGTGYTTKYISSGDLGSLGLDGNIVIDVQLKTSTAGTTTAYVDEEYLEVVYEPLGDYNKLATNSDLTAYTTTSDAYTTVKTFTISVTGGRVVKEINYKADIKNSTAATTTSLKLMSGDDMKEATKIGSEVTRTYTTYAIRYISSGDLGSLGLDGNIVIDVQLKTSTAGTTTAYVDDEYLEVVYTKGPVDLLSTSKAIVGNYVLLPTGNVGIGNAAPAGRFIVSPPATETIGAAATITADACGTIKKINATAARTTDTTDTFTAPSDANTGCIMTVVNVDDTDTITLDANANFKTSTGANVALTAYDVVTVVSDGALWYQVAIFSANADIAEWYSYRGDRPQPGDLVSISDGNIEIEKSSQPYDSRLSGIVSTQPQTVLGQESTDAVAIALTGRVPLKVFIENGQIEAGDNLTSSSLPGIGMKATKAGQIVGKALESTNIWNEQNCPTVSSLEEIVWPEDDGTNPAKPCFKIPDPSNPSGQIYIGKIMAFVNVSWYDPDVYLTDSSNLLISSAAQYYQIIKEGTQEVINRIGVFAEVVVANIRAGAITTRQLAADSLTAFTATIDNLLINNGLVSPIVQTNLISPLADNTDVVIQVGKVNEDDTSGFGKLIIKDATGSAVTTFDSSGNVYTEGSISARSASISGELYAETIHSTTLDEIEKQLKQVKEDQGLLAQAKTWETNTATDSAQIVSSEEFIVNNLFVTGQAAIDSLSVSNSFTLGSDFVISTTAINTLSSPLSLQSLALAPVEIMAGKIRIDTGGNMIITGNLAIAGDLEVKGKTKLKEVELERLVIANGSTPGESSPSATPGVLGNEILTNATAGNVTIPAGVPEITINNPNVGDNTLVYVTPTSPSQNNVLYVKTKETGKFVVGFTNPIDIDVSFNWWIIEVGQ